MAKNKGVKGAAGDVWHGLQDVGKVGVNVLSHVDPATWFMHGKSSGPAPAAPGAYRAEDMINSVWTGLNPQQTDRIKQLLAQQGVTEKSNVHEFRAHLEALNNSVPGLSQYSKDASIFQPQNTGAGDISGLAQALAMIDKPYMNDLNQRADAYQQMMSPLIAKLPAGLANMENVSTNQQVQGMKNLATSQLLASQAQPVASALQLAQRLQQSIGQSQLRQALTGVGTASALPPLGPVPST